jgi:hypothetical protein
MKKLWQVWMEGYCVSGNEDTARYLGTYNAATFKEAVLLAVICHDMTDDLVIDYHDNSCCWWGCKFYDNEVGARKKFG